ncbi:hypothetical protein TNCV_157711 [Trichonephila clavipes]|nr:hypothetical protein TNCV_157711 [Trichonephila clavipes]
MFAASSKERNDSFRVTLLYRRERVCSCQSAGGDLQRDFFGRHRNTGDKRCRILTLMLYPGYTADKHRVWLISVERCTASPTLHGGGFSYGSRNFVHGRRP